MVSSLGGGPSLSKLVFGLAGLVWAVEKLGVSWLQESQESKIRLRLSCASRVSAPASHIGRGDEVP